MSNIIFFSLKVLPSTERFNLNVSYFKTHFCHSLLTYRRGLLPPLKVYNYLQKERKFVRLKLNFDPNVINVFLNPPEGDYPRITFLLDCSDDLQRRPGEYCEDGGRAALCHCEQRIQWMNLDLLFI